MIAEYLELKEQDNGRFRYHSDDNLQKLAKLVAMRNNTLSMYVKKNVGLNIREKSNGESAIRYFFDNITENALYLLDEPENSLAPLRQQELVQYLEEAVRFYNCQFIIASHSPFVLAMSEAKVKIWISGRWKSSGGMSWRVSGVIMNSLGSMRINLRPEGNREKRNIVKYIALLLAIN